MRTGTAFVALAALAAAGGGCQMFPSHTGELPGQISQPAVALTFDFESSPADRIPQGFVQAKTDGGAPPDWKVLETNQAAGGKKVLAQASADPTNGRYPVCACEFFYATNVAVSVKFRSISGKVDQAGGVVLRYRDANNYYVARANALEDNVRFYKVQGGKRTQLAGLDTKVTGEAWHKLSLRAHGNHFTVTFDDKSFEADDATFPGSGVCGLWTKADSVTWFDDMMIEGYDPK